MARPTKITGMDVTPFSGVKIQKVGAIYTRTLEEGGAIYLENGVYTPNGKGGNPVPTKACLRLFPPGMSKSAAAFGPCCCSTWPNGMALLLNSSFLAKEYKKDAYGQSVYTGTFAVKNHLGIGKDKGFTQPNTCS